MAETTVTASSISYALAASAGIVAITDLLCWWLDIPSWRYAMMTLITVSLATAVPQIRDWFAGAFEVGVALSFTFFAAIAIGKRCVKKELSSTDRIVIVSNKKF